MDWADELAASASGPQVINDSKTPFGSNRDRHANIGEGQIGEAGFAALLKDPRLARVPFILEVPGFDGRGPDARNLEILKRLAA